MIYWLMMIYFGIFLLSTLGAMLLGYSKILFILCIVDSILLFAALYFLGRGKWIDDFIGGKHVFFTSFNLLWISYIIYFSIVIYHVYFYDFHT
jgi:hypothetical protein